MNISTIKHNRATKRITLLSFLTLMITMCMSFMATSAYASVDDFTFTELTVNANLSKNSENQSVLQVEEKYVANFVTPNQNRGMVRALPTTWNQGDYIMNLNIQGVFNENNEAVYYEVEEDGTDQVLLIDDDTYKTGLHTYIIKWTATGVTGFFEESQTEEFYWNLITGDRPQSVEAAQINLTIAPEVLSSLTGNNVCYQGSLGSTEKCSLTENNGTFSTEVQPLNNYGALTVAIGFEKGTFATPEMNPTKKLPGAMLILFGGIVAGFITAIVVRNNRRKKAIADLNIHKNPVVAQYSPPKNWSAIEGSIFLNTIGYLSTLRERVLASSILELALGGNLQISGNNNDMTLQRQNNVSDNKILQKVNETIFSESNVVDAKKLKPLTIDSDIQAQLNASNLLQKVKTKIPLWIWLLPVVVSVAVYVYVQNILAVFGVFVIFGILALINYIIFHGLNKPVTTQEGEDLANYMLGLKLYIEVAEEERIKMLQSVEGAENKTLNGIEIIHLYEKLLPWAIIFGLEDSWQRVIKFRVDQLEQHDRDNYYHAGYSYYYVNNVSNLVHTTQQAVSAYDAAQARTSGSGGSMGGGFSGGGGGGGSVGGR
jgi:uncharacterized membrane protein YgcG